MVRVLNSKTQKNQRYTMNTDPEREEDIATNRLKQTAQGAASQAQQQASGIMGTAKEKLGSMTESAKSAASAARDRAGELLEDARETAHDVYERARERVTVWSEDGLQYVREYPGRCILGALLAGVVLGFSLRRH
jgi:ElaB/YqjD/DUF883 family membrane-anchored ribosome-binding protein